MGMLEGITHSEEIEQLLNDAQTQYDSAVERMETQKQNTSKSLEKLGEAKLKAWSDDINGFLDSFGSFNNIQMVCVLDEKFNFVGEDATPDELMVNMHQATLTAKEVFRDGVLAVGTGALVGVATYGGVAMFAKASTGTAIASLSGIAKKNATLAWLGGGAKKIGGLGMAGGTVVLGGIVVTAIVGVAAALTAAKAKERLAEAKKTHAQAMNAVSKMEVVITGMKGIEKISNNYNHFIKNLSKLVKPYLKEMDDIAKKYERDDEGKVRFDDLSEIEQRTLHISWLLAQLYYHILSVPLLTDDGDVNPTSRALLQTAEQEYSQLSGEVTKLENDKKQIKELISEAKSLFKESLAKFDTAKKNTSKELVSIGQERVQLWENNIGPWINMMNSYDGIDISIDKENSITGLPIEVIFENSQNVIEGILEYKNERKLDDEYLVEIALYGGEEYFIARSGNREAVVNYDLLHSKSLWFVDKFEKFDEDRVVYSGLTQFDIKSVENRVKSINGRENVEQAGEVNSAVKGLATKIEQATSDFEIMLNRSKKIDKSLKRFSKIQTNFIDKLKELSKSGGQIAEYEYLSEDEKKIIERSAEIAEIQYAILSSSILTDVNSDGDYLIEDTIQEADKYYKSEKKKSLLDKGYNITISDILWSADAKLAMYAGFGTSALWLFLMIMQLASKNLIGLVGILGAGISCPIFFYLKNLQQSKLCIFRYARITLSIVVMIFAEILYFMR